MKVSRSLFLTWMILTMVPFAVLGEDAPPKPELARALVQAKKVYVISGHVRYHKTKGLFKKELVDETPFEEPCRKELEKWGRFTLVTDIKDADLVIRAYEKGQSNYVPVVSPGVTGSVNVGQSFFILDVWQPSSKKVIWSASKNVGTSWSTNTGIANLVKRLREYVEEQEKSDQSGTSMQAQAGSSVPGLDVSNAAMFQKSFTAVKSDGTYQAFAWPGFYEINNPSDKPVSITDVHVAWAPASFGGKQVSLVLQSKPGKAAVFHDKDAIIAALRQHQESSPQDFPVSIPAHATWYLEIPFQLELSDGQKSLRFQDENEADKWLSGALVWQLGQDGKFHCLAEDVSVDISTADGQTQQYRPRTVLLVPGCLLNTPPVVKSVASKDWKKYSFPEDGIEFSSPSAPTFLQQDQHSHIVNLGSSYVIFGVEQFQQNPKDPVAPKTVLQAARANFLRARKYELVSAVEAAVGGNPGVEFEAKNDKYRCRVRFFLVKEKLISSEVVGLAAAPLPSEASEVLDSLRLIPVAEAKSN